MDARVCVCPSAGLEEKGESDAAGNRPLLPQFHGRPAHSTLTIVTELSWLSKEQYSLLRYLL